MEQRGEQVAAAQVVGVLAVAGAGGAVEAAGVVAVAQAHHVEHGVGDGRQLRGLQAVASALIQPIQAGGVQAAMAVVFAGGVRHGVAPIVGGAAGLVGVAGEAGLEEPVQIGLQDLVVAFDAGRVVFQQFVGLCQVEKTVAEHHLLVPRHGQTGFIWRVGGEVHAVAVGQLDQRFQDVLVNRLVGLAQIGLGALQIGGAEMEGVAAGHFLVVYRSGFQYLPGAAAQVARRVALFAAGLDRADVRLVRPYRIDAAGPDHSLASWRRQDVVAFRQQRVAEGHHLVQQGLARRDVVNQGHGFQIFAAAALRPFVVDIGRARLQPLREIDEGLDFVAGDRAVQAVHGHGGRLRGCAGKGQAYRQGKVQQVFLFHDRFFHPEVNKASSILQCFSRVNILFEFSSQRQ